MYVFFQLPTDVFGVVHAHCYSLFSNKTLINFLKSKNFTVALVDLMANECSLALAHHLGLPYIGYWGMSLQGSEVRKTLHRSTQIIITSGKNTVCSI